MFYALLPCAAYFDLALSAFPAACYPREALFAVGAAALVLLFSGIHNAWDSTAYHVFVPMANPDAEPRPQEAKGSEKH